MALQILPSSCVFSAASTQPLVVLLLVLVVPSTTTTVTEYQKVCFSVFVIRFIQRQP